MTPDQFLNGGKPQGQDINSFLGGGDFTVLPTNQSYFSRVGSSIKEDASKRTDTVGRIQQSNASPISKAVQTFGQGAGLAANAIETAVGEVPGIKQGLQYVGAGINKLSTSKPIAKIGDVIGNSQTLQELVGLYDNDTNFKDTVDSVANIFRLGSDVAVGGVGGKTAKAAASGVKAPSLKVPAVVSNVTRDVIPTVDRVVNHQVVRSLDLTQGDVKNINLSTGHDVGEFLARNNLIKGNKPQTVTAIDDFYKQNYNQVRTEIGKVKTEYPVAEVPRYTEALKAIKQQINETPGLQAENAEVDALLQKASPTLNDIQRVKELMDEHFQLYKATGDVKDSVAKQGLANIRSDLKTFLETEVKKETGADIKPLNNNVQTSRSINDAIEERSTRGLTRSNISLGDFGTFGVGMTFGGPVMGVAAVLAKRIIETPTFGLRFAKFLDGLSDAQKIKIKQQIQAGEIPPELDALYSDSPNIQSNQMQANTGAATNQRSTVMPETLPQASAPAKKTLLERARAFGSSLKDNMNEKGAIKNPFASKSALPSGVPVPKNAIKELAAKDFVNIRNKLGNKNTDPSSRIQVDMAFQETVDKLGLEGKFASDEALLAYLKDVLDEWQTQGTEGGLIEGGIETY